MGSPTELETEQLYPLNAYGSAMAPLFMNLTFWIGAFMLLVIMKQEVDGEGIRNLTVTQRYLGRFALLAVMAVLQAVICCAGVLVIGVLSQGLVMVGLSSNYQNMIKGAVLIIAVIMDTRSKQVGTKRLAKHEG